MTNRPDLKNKETGRRVTGRISNKMITKNYKKKNGLKLKGDNTLKKNFKRVSAIILAAAMSMSSSVIASAAKMNIYVREYDGDAKKVTKIYPDKATTPTIVLDTTPGESIYEAIDAGKVATDSNNILGASIASKWTKVTNKDGSIDWYLLSLGVSNGTGKTFDTKTNKNSYSNLEYDDDNNIIHGKWEGSSWMWLEGGAEKIDSVAYPEYTMSDAKCPSSDFSIILSYDDSSLTW